MGFGEAVQSAFKKTFVYQGRATRSEYWWFYLFYVLSFAVFATVCVVVAGITNDHNSGGSNPIGGGLFALMFLYLIALAVVQLPLAVRRLHDSNKSGFFLLLGFVPLGGFVLLAFFCMPSTEGPNQYGEHPLRSHASVF